MICFFFQAEDGIRDIGVTGVQTCALPIYTFRAVQLDEPTLAYDVTVPEPLIRGDGGYDLGAQLRAADRRLAARQLQLGNPTAVLLDPIRRRSGEHTSELQSRQYLVCRLLLEKKKN